MVIKDEVLDMMCDPQYGQPDLYARLVRFCRQELPLAQQQGKVDEWVKAMTRTPEYEAMAFGYRDQQEAPKELTTQRVERTSCPECSGTGSVLMDGDCSDCNGKGYGWEPAEPTAVDVGGISDAEIAGIMGWRGPGAYTEATLRKIKRILDVDRNYRMKGAK